MFHTPAHKQTNPAALPAQIVNGVMPAHAYLIKPVNGEVIALHTPLVGKWYAGMTILPFDDFIEAGALARYIGDGEFIDAEGETVDMNGYDYLAEQL